MQSRQLIGLAPQRHGDNVPIRIETIMTDNVPRDNVRSVSSGRDRDVFTLEIGDCSYFRPAVQRQSGADAAESDALDS